MRIGIAFGLTLMGTRPGTALHSLGAALALRESVGGRRERTLRGMSSCSAPQRLQESSGIWGRPATP